MKNINKTMELMANGMSISKALAEVYKTRNVQIPFRKCDLKIPVEDVGFCNRAMRCFDDAKLKTVAQVVDYISKNGYRAFHYLGKATAIDISEHLLDLAWSKLNKVERAEFLLLVDEENEAKED